MRNLLRKVRRGEKGFTLVEMLIVVAIIGVLAAIIIPNLTGLAGTGETEAAATELALVQTSVDIMMVKEGISGNLTSTSATSNMAAFPSGNPIYPTYTRSDTTKGTYSCDTNGNVTQVTTGY